MDDAVAAVVLAAVGALYALLTLAWVVGVWA